MKTWQMIKELTENPEKEFTRKSDGLHIKTNKYEELVWDSGYQFLRLHHDWEEIKKPVTFMEAITSGKKISVQCAIETYEGKGKLRDIYYRQPNEMLRALAGYGDEVAIYIILNGKWYIEDWEE